MTRDEAKRVLGRMTAAWPKQELAVPTAEIWIEHLISKRADLAMECVRDLEQGSKWFPSISEFNVEYDAKVHYETATNADERGLPTPEPTKASPEFVREIVAEMQEIVERGRAKLAQAELVQRGAINKTLEDSQ